MISLTRITHSKRCRFNIKIGIKQRHREGSSATSCEHMASPSWLFFIVSKDNNNWNFQNNLKMFIWNLLLESLTKWGHKMTSYFSHSKMQKQNHQNWQGKKAIIGDYCFQFLIEHPYKKWASIKRCLNIKLNLYDWIKQYSEFSKAYTAVLFQ